MDKFVPGSIKFDQDEIARINNVRIGERLGKFPHEVRAAPYWDIKDCVDIWRAEDLYREKTTKKG